MAMGVLAVVDTDSDFHVNITIKRVTRGGRTTYP